MRKLLLCCNYPLGDQVLLTAAVRDLHAAYPGRFQTSVRTSCPDLWIGYPLITPEPAQLRDVEQIDCDYPLIERANQSSHHALHGFIEFLNEHLALRIRLTQFRGDIRLTDAERAQPSAVETLAGSPIPFWIIDAGGKHDCTIKWWSAPRYQEVVDHFRDRLLFVHVGHRDDYHPPLKGVLDLRGKTRVRDLIRLIYHAQGVVCPVTSLMHLAAAIELPPGAAGRACVVVAGGREPPHWEAYPNHQFIHTVGTLDCCRHGGCWRARTFELGDLRPQDVESALCVNVAGFLPRCMDLIDAAQVIRRVETYLEPGRFRTLARADAPAVASLRSRPVDLRTQALSVDSSAQALDLQLSATKSHPPAGRGRGIVICGGGLRYFPGVWVAVRLLRRLGNPLPIQVWHLGSAEVEDEERRLLEPYGVECVDAFDVARSHPVRRLGGWELKSFALEHCPFAEVLELDADNVPLTDPHFLFDEPAYAATGALVWPDRELIGPRRSIWRLVGLEPREVRATDSGQVLVNKAACWPALQTARWMNDHSDLFYHHILGDKDTLLLGLLKTGLPFAMPSTPVQTVDGVMCQHDFSGRRVFQHRTGKQWSITGDPPAHPQLELETECRAFMDELRSRWSWRRRTWPLQPARLERCPPP